jgi:hypothetical protein
VVLEPGRSAFRAAPVVVVADHLGDDVGLEGLQRVGAGADRLEARAVGARRQRLGADHHAAVGRQPVLHLARGLTELELHGLLVDRLVRGDEVEGVLHGGADGLGQPLRPVEVGDDRLCVDGRAVVEGGALTQRERELREVVVVLPLLGQAGDRLARVGEVDDPVVDREQRLVGEAAVVLRVRRVQCLVAGRVEEDQLRFRVRGRRSGAAVSPALAAIAAATGGDRQGGS